MRWRGLAGWPLPALLVPREALRRTVTRSWLPSGRPPAHAVADVIRIGHPLPCIRTSLLPCLVRDPRRGGPARIYGLPSPQPQRPSSRAAPGRGTIRSFSNPRLQAVSGPAGLRVAPPVGPRTNPWWARRSCWRGRCLLLFARLPQGVVPRFLRADFRCAATDFDLWTGLCTTGSAVWRNPP